MPSDPLYRPLGLDRPDVAGRRRARLRRRWLTAVALAVGATGAIGWGVRHGGRGAADGPVAVATIEVARPAEVVPTFAAPPVAPPPAAKVITMGQSVPAPSANSVEVQNGVKIIRFNPAGSSASVSIPVEAADPVALRPAPDPRVSEKTADGVLPRVGPAGIRASAIYARPPSATGDSPRIALVLAGMGADQLATADAGRRWPPDLDFALAPEVPDGGAQAAEIRRAGREVVMDLRAQPPEAPGSASLLRRMGAWPGYVGALLTPNRATIDGPLIAARGASVVIAPGLDAGNGAIGADLVIDATVPDLAEALDRLVSKARADGGAVAIIDHATAGQTTIAAFLDRMGRQGIAVVPLSALANTGASNRAMAR